MYEFVNYHERKVPATYIGDAVYALNTGHGILLRLNDHRNEDGEIYLEQDVMNNLISFINSCPNLGSKEDERKESENLASTNGKQER